MASRRSPIFEDAIATHPGEAMTVAIEEERRVETARALSYRDWVALVPTPHGPVDLHRFRFQAPLYTERAANDRELVIKKATQLGVSEWAIRWTLFWADMRGKTMLYVVPTEKFLSDFCVAASERVLMADGTVRAIRDVGVGDLVWSSDGVDVVPDRVVARMDTGVQEVLRVRIAGGRAIRVTAHHRVYSNRGWVEAGELRAGDLVCVPHVLPAPLDPVAVSPDDAFLLALWLAEGSKTSLGFHVTCGNEAVRARLREIAAERCWTVKEHPRLGLYVGMRFQRGPATPIGLLRRYGVRGMRTETVCVPDAIMRADTAAAEEFLRTYLACDGWVGPDSASLTSVSECIVRDLQVLAARLGIPGRVTSVQPSYPGARRAWTLAFTTAAARARLVNVQVPGKPVSARIVPRARGQAVVGNALDHAITTGRRAGLLQREVGAQLGISQTMVWRAEERMRRHPWCVPSSDALGWSAVEAVTPDGHEPTFDLETETHHAFFLQGALTHNSQHRVREVLRKSEWLRSRMGDEAINNKGQRQVGLGWTYWRGAAEAVNLESIPADGLMLDEYDSLEPGNIGVAEQRITGPLSEGLIRRVGVPSIPGGGIARAFEDTTQHLWMVRCETCGERQPMTGSDTYRDNVDEALEMLVCRKCRRALDTGAGEWVASYPDRDVLGFWMTKFALPSPPLRSIIRNHAKTSPADRTTHYNRDLGEEYADASGRLDRAALLACTRSGEIHPSPGGLLTFNAVTMGIDVASARALNVRVSEHLNDYTKKLVWVGHVEVPDPDDTRAAEKLVRSLSELMRRFDVNMAAIDHLPERTIASTFCARHPGRAYLVAYSTEQRPKRTWNVDDDEHFVTVHRTTAIDATLQAFREQRNLLPDLDELPGEYPDHLGALIRVQERDEKDKVKVYYRSQGADDYGQAEIYDLVATELLHRARGLVAVQRAMSEPEAMRDPHALPERLDDTYSPALEDDEDVFATGGDWEQ